MPKFGLLLAVCLVLTLAAACSTDTPTLDPTAEPAMAIAPTAAPIPTATPEPTATAEPVPTPEPTPEVTPTATPQLAALFEYSRAVRLLEIQEFDDSIAAFDLVIRKLPDFGRAYYRRGLAFNGDERVERALEDFATAIELEPDYPGPYIARARILIDRSDTDAARVDLEQAIDVANPIRDASAIRTARLLLGQLN